MKKLTLLTILMSFTLASACTPSENSHTEQLKTGFTDRSTAKAQVDADIELAKRPKPKPTATPKPRKTPEPKPQPKPSLKQI